MKMYIVGSVASGKPTLAKKLSEILSIPYQSLNEVVVYITDKSNYWGNRKRQVKDRDKLFYSVIDQPKWIIEDTGRTCFENGLKKETIKILINLWAMY